jgi:serine/threonine protein phosphatase PrpC
VTTHFDIACALRNVEPNERGTRYHSIVCAPERALLLTADSVGAWSTGWEIAAEMVREVERRLAEIAIDRLDADGFETLCREAHDAAARRIDGETVTEQVNAAGLLVGPRSAELFWAGDYKLFLIRDQRVVAETSPHSAAEALVKQMSRREAYRNDPLDPFKFMRLRALQLGAGEGFERLAVPWTLQPGDHLLLGNLATWRSFDDAELVAHMAAGQPPIDRTSNKYQFSAIVTV